MKPLKAQDWRLLMDCLGIGNSQNVVLMRKTTAGKWSFRTTTLDDEGVSLDEFANRVLTYNVEGSKRSCASIPGAL